MLQLELWTGEFLQDLRVSKPSHMIPQINYLNFSLKKSLKDPRTPSGLLSPPSYTLTTVRSIPSYCPSLQWGASKTFLTNLGIPSFPSHFLVDLVLFPFIPPTQLLFLPGTCGCCLFFKKRCQFSNSTLMSLIKPPSSNQKVLPWRYKPAKPMTSPTLPNDLWKATPINLPFVILIHVLYLRGKTSTQRRSIIQ